MAGSLSCAQILELAQAIAKVPGYTTYADWLFNAILDDLAQSYDFDVAKGTYSFNFSTAAAAIGNLNASLASGPMFLPADYLRAKRGDIKWFNAGFPMELVPVDLEEFDSFVQQPGLMSFPTIWVTDMSQTQFLTTTGTTHGTTTLDGLASTTGVYVGTVVLGQDIPAFTTVTAINSPTSVTLSKAATASNVGENIIFQQPPMAYVWPPSSGSYPAMVRYYRQVPPIATPDANTVSPWFPNSQFLITELAGRLMQIAGDDRWEAFLSDNEALHPGGSRVILKRYLTLKDDSSDRSKRVTLDRRRFGAGWSSLPKSKVLGW